MHRLMITLVLLAIDSPVWASSADDWAAAKGFTVVEESDGWSFPVDIAFVPEPGPNPSDPLYYVTELRGTIKVVTRDRTVHTYAEGVNRFRPLVELPDQLAEAGLAGVCLDPERGYLYATSVYTRGGALYNKIVRFEHAGGTFALEPSGSEQMTQIFDVDESAISHQIGKCAVASDGRIFVGVGDGMDPYKAQQLDSPNGKVLRINPDFSAPVDNPFYDPRDPQAVRGYVYVYGVRNPFGITLDEGDQLYIADNGPRYDRLIEAIPGKNYLWDGRNRTILGNGFWTYPISVGPAAMLHLGKDTYFPEWRGNVLVGQGGPTHQAGPSHSGRFEIRRFPVRAGRGLTGKPARVVSFKGQYQQILVPVAEGPDGLYFSGFLPGPDGRTTLLKVVRREGATADVAFLTGAELYHEKGCDGCHQIGGQGGSVGPALDGVVDRLLERLGSSQYAAKLDAVDELETEVHIQYRDARDELRKLAGDDAVRFWLRRHLEQPRFDAAQSQMPDLQLSDEEVDQLATYVMTLRGPRDPKLGAKDAAYLRLVRFFQSGSLMRPEVGFLAGVLALFLVQRVTRRVRRRST